MNCAWLTVSAWTVSVLLAPMVNPTLFWAALTRTRTPKFVNSSVCVDALASSVSVWLVAPPPASWKLNDWLMVIGRPSPG
jgi:hypothetical protein